MNRIMTLRTVLALSVFVGMLTGCQDMLPPRVVHAVFPPEKVIVHQNGDITLEHCFSAPITVDLVTKLYYTDSRGRIQVIYAREWSYVSGVRLIDSEAICDMFTAIFSPTDLQTIIAVHVDYETRR